MIQVNLCLNSRHLILILLLLGLNKAYAEFKFSPEINYLKPALSQEINLNEWARLKAIFLETENDREEFQWEDVTPVGVASDHEGRKVASVMITRGAEQMVSSKAFQNSALGAGTKSIDKSLSTKSTSTTSTTSSPRTDTTTTKPRVEMQMRSVQGKASVHYHGLADTAVTYHLYNQSLHAEASRLISKDLRVVLDHLESPEDKVERLSLRWSW